MLRVSGYWRSAFPFDPRDTHTRMVCWYDSYFLAGSIGWGYCRVKVDNFWIIENIKSTRPSGNPTPTLWPLGVGRTR